MTKIVLSCSPNSTSCLYELSDDGVSMTRMHLGVLGETRLWDKTNSELIPIYHVDYTYGYGHYCHSLVDLLRQTHPRGTKYYIMKGQYDTGLRWFGDKTNGEYTTREV